MYDAHSVLCDTQLFRSFQPQSIMQPLDIFPSEGLLSTTEAVHFGKPVIGISVFYDQRLNMKLAQQKGYGIDVTYENLSEENLKSAIREMLTNSRFLFVSECVSDRSSLRFVFEISAIPRLQRKYRKDFMISLAHRWIEQYIGWNMLQGTKVRSTCRAQVCICHSMFTIIWMFGRS